MATDHLQTRGDFRCALCRDKGCFHCEHDTPYRDQYLGTYDANTPANHRMNTRRAKSNDKMHNNSTHNSGRHGPSSNHDQYNGKQPNSTTGALAKGRHGVSNTGAAHQQEYGTAANHHTDASSKAAKQSKACVIL
jgi:hypothetical protein